MKSFFDYIHSLSVYTKLAVVILFMTLFIATSTVLIALDISKNNTNKMVEELITSTIQTNQNYIESAILANDSWSLYKFLKSLVKTKIIKDAGILDLNNRVIAHTDTEKYRIGELFSHDEFYERIPFISNDLQMGIIVLDIEKESIHNILKDTLLIDFIFLLLAIFLSFFVANIFIGKLLKRFDIVLHNTKAISQRKWDMMKYDTCKENDEITQMVQNSFIFMEEIKNSIKKEESLKNFYHDILQSVDALIVICDLELNIKYQNSHRLSKHILNEEKNLFLDEVFSHLKDKNQYTFSLKKADKTLVLYVQKKVINERIVFSFADITLIHQEEENKKILHSLEVLGEISSIFAHEIKNLLQPLKLLLPKKRLPDEEDMPRIHETFSKISNQVTDFLQLGKPILVTQSKTLHVRDIFEEITNSLQVSLDNKNLRLMSDIEDDLSLHVTKNSIEIIIMNLLTNAIEAAYEDSTIYISWNTIQTNLTLLKVQNEGDTIPVDIQDNLFKPFFTTKKDGSGLGLFSVYKIVHTMHGRVELSSKNNFTSFNIFIPKKGNK